MGSLLKTKQVSEMLGVNPSTIHRWVKFFHIPCHKNEHGHYFFSENDIYQLRHIQEQLNNRTTMEEITGNLGKVDSNMTKSEHQVDNEQMAKRVSELERRIDKKADDVVSYQLFQHRNEIDELMKKVIDLEKKLETLQHTNSNQLDLSIGHNLNPFGVDLPLNEKPRHKSNWVLHLFGLLQ